MNIFQWPAADDGCAWWRLQTPAVVLRRLGHIVRTSRYAAPSWIASADTIIAQRVVNPGPTLRWREWHANGKYLVFDIDDHLEQLPLTSPEAYRFFNDPDVRDRLHANLGRADRITAATPRLAEWASQYNDDVVVVPNGLPAELLGWTRKPNPHLILGWAGSLHTLTELEPLAPHLVTTLNRNPGIEVRIVGVHPDPEHVRQALRPLGLDRADVTVTPWAEPGLDYLHNVFAFDVWLAPYRPSPFNKAKVATKAIEAAVLGIPIIASHIGAYATTVQHMLTGLTVKHDYQWVRYMQHLIDQPDQLAAMAAAARSAGIHHTVEAHGQLWEKALTP